MIPEIQQALAQRWEDCFADHRWIDIKQIEDLIGNGSTVVLAQYCHMGAYTSEVAVLQLKNEKPVLSKFRDGDKKRATPPFLQGASVRNGEDTRLSAEKHAVYAIHYDTNDDGGLRTCKVEAYVWFPPNSSFDYNSSVSDELRVQACKEIEKQVGPADIPE